MPIPSKLKALTAIAGAVILTLVAAAPAGAHMEVKPAKVPATGEVRLKFTVGHGCEHSPTTSIAIQLPPQVSEAEPLPKRGWKEERGDGEVSWRGGSLDAHSQGSFRLQVQLDGEPGERVPFKVIQGCSEGEQAWIEMPAEGGPEPEHPAPVITLIAGHPGNAAGDSGEAAHEHADREITDEHADAEQTVAEADAEDGKAEAEDDGEEKGGEGLPLVVLVAIGVAAGMAAGSFSRRRRNRDGS